VAHRDCYLRHSVQLLILCKFFFSQGRQPGQKRTLIHLAIVLQECLEAALGQIEIVCWDDWVDIWELILQITALVYQSRSLVLVSEPQRIYRCHSRTHL